MAHFSMRYRASLLFVIFSMFGFSYANAQLSRVATPALSAAEDDELTEYKEKTMLLKRLKQWLNSHKPKHPETIKPVSLYKILEEQMPSNADQSLAVNILDEIKTSNKDAFTLAPLSVLQDLEILQGRHDEKFSFLSRIDKTKTFLGHVLLAKHIACPTTNIETLHHRQTLTKVFVDNKELFDKCSTMLTELKNLEPEVLSILHYGTGCELEDLNFSHNILPLITWFLPSPLRKKINDSALVKKIDRSPAALEVCPYLNAGATLSSIGAGILFSGNIIKGLYNFATTVKDNGLKTTLKNTLQEGRKTVSKEFENKNFLGKSLACMNVSRKVLFRLFEPVMTYQITAASIRQLKYLFKKIKRTHDTLTKLAVFINRYAKNVLQDMQQNPIIKKTFPNLEVISAIVNNTDNSCKELSQLLDLLKTNTFSEKASIFFCRKGRLVAAYTLLNDIAKKLTPFFEALGTIDMYVSLATLYKESQGTQAKYCFVSYKQSDKPYIALNNYWNPFIDPNIVVPNNIGTLDLANGQNRIISGPNAGGKSTTMKAIGINILMAQTVGIAPAEALTLTPFSYIDTHLNITDDVSKKQSLYMAEATRFKQIIDTLKSLRKDQFGFIIFDEVFNSTNPESGSSIGRAMGKYMAKYLPNTICIIASHLSDLTNLEKDTNGAYKNFKVCVEHKTNAAGEKEIKYPYTLERGKADQSVAIEILEKLGFDREITDEANKFYGTRQRLLEHGAKAAA